MQKDEDLNIINGKKIDRILYILENDDSIGKIGLVQKVDINEKKSASDSKRIDDLENINEKKDFANKKISVVYGSIGTALLFVLEELLHWLKIIK